MCSSISDVLALDRAVSGVLVQVNNRMLIHRGLRTAVSAPNTDICRYFAMGRVGIEPATLGLRGAFSCVYTLAEAGRKPLLSQMSSCVLGSSGGTLLTFC